MRRMWRWAADRWNRPTEAEEAEAAARWAAGPGARPTMADYRRMRRAMEEGRMPTGRPPADARLVEDPGGCAP